MLSYPFLPSTVAHKLANELLTVPIEDLYDRRDVSHHDAVLTPTGGNRVNESYLQEIAQRVRESAKGYGYPALANDSGVRKFDSSVGRILLEMMDISPSEASNPGVWSFMSCIVLPDIVRWRFPGAEGGTSRDRFLGGRRNTFGRLWWRAYLLKQSAGENPYELLDLLGEDELVQITERPSLAGSPLLAKTVCRVFLDITSQSSDMHQPQPRLLLRDTMKRLRRLLPMVSFDALDEYVLKSLIYEVFCDSVKFLES